MKGTVLSSARASAGEFTPLHRRQQGLRVTSLGRWVHKVLDKRTPLRENDETMREEGVLMLDLDKAVLGMAALRLLSGSTELVAAAFMLKWNQIEKALALNTVLALVGPLVLITTTAIGLVGIAGALPLSKLLLILAGVALVLIGLRA